jgi:MFS family permease
MAQSVDPSVQDTKLPKETIPTPSGSINEKDEMTRDAGADINTTEKTSQGDSTSEEDFEYPKAWALAAITLALCLSVFCMALVRFDSTDTTLYWLTFYQDNTIIATAIPRITDDFKALNDVGWYGSSYLLTTCAMQLIFGKFYTFYSIKWVYLIAIFIFELGSLICAVAPNSTTLIVGRAIAGVGSAGIFSGAVLIVANTVPLRQRPTYMGAIGGMYGIASVAGPLWVSADMSVHTSISLTGT